MARFLFPALLLPVGEVVFVSAVSSVHRVDDWFLRPVSSLIYIDDPCRVAPSRNKVAPVIFHVYFESHPACQRGISFSLLSSPSKASRSFMSPSLSFFFSSVSDFYDGIFPFFVFPAIRRAAMLQRVAVSREHGLSDRMLQVEISSRSCFGANVFSFVPVLSLPYHHRSSA